MSSKVNIFDIPVNGMTFKAVLSELEIMLELKGSCKVCTFNPEFALETLRDKDFKQAVLSSKLILPDGIGILWAAKYLSLKRHDIFTWFGSLCMVLFQPSWIKTVLSEVVAGSDLFWPLMELAAKRGKKVFLLGAAEGVAVRVSDIAGRKYPNLKIVGTFSGSPKLVEEEKIVEKINLAEAEILLLAYNFSDQEKWIYRNLNKLQTVMLVMGVGGTFDFVAGTEALGGYGKARRAPLFFRKLGLEWFFRLVTQPYRWRRIWRAVVVFPWEVYKRSKRQQGLPCCDR